MPKTGTPSRPPRRRWRGWWLKQLHTWHWISAAISLSAMLLFAVTGITLNHAAAIGATPRVSERSATLPPGERLLLRAEPDARADPLPLAVAERLRGTIGLDVRGRAAEWSDTEVYVALPRAGGDAWVSVDRATGRVTAEVTDRGWIAWLNDLHKGRNTGDAWFWFIDLFAGACIVFTLTGLLLLQLHARHRPLTWPLVALGMLVPALLALFFLH
ncbi:PepSY-associated TM helix domain-containing protein [Sphingomonas sp. BK235]|uniref:PepSY-associated TM helix domain-containing protein n=1 Tax=Sphingomonas sp. BK235 TaxID=2512131 RepID=UPI0010512905|nr:PepSY-associated TM helix domain-containing protein [Sphingomonas sp. BK235]